MIVLINELNLYNDLTDITKQSTIFSYSDENHRTIHISKAQIRHAATEIRKL